MLLQLVAVAATLVPGPEAAGTTRTVSFGLPLPPGVLTNPALVTVLDPAGRELPAFVRPLGTWQRMPPPEMLCAAFPHSGDPGLRSVLVQFEYTFAGSQPAAVNIVLNRTPALSRTRETPLSDTLRLVQEGTYAPSDGIYEPAVYVLLKPDWLTCSGLDTLPSATGARPFLAAFDKSLTDLFPAVTNSFNPYPHPFWINPYLTSYEPWLYDRAQTFFNGYVRTGSLDFLREGYRASRHYLSLLYQPADCPANNAAGCVGFFKLRNPDPAAVAKIAMYSYAENIATLYWLSGDAEALARVGEPWAATTHAIPLGSPWQDLTTITERNMAVALLNAVMNYEVAGGADAQSQVSSTLTALQQMQNQDGCFVYHPEEAPDLLGFSPWMSSVLGHSLLRTYHTFGDDRARSILLNLAVCVAGRGVYLSSGAGSPRYWMPRYLAAAAGTPRELGGAANDGANIQHALDVAYLMGVGSFLAPNTELGDTLAATAARLLQAHLEAQLPASAGSGWQGKGRPEYIVSPPRKYSWWFKNSGALGRTLAPGAPALARITFDAMYASPGRPTLVEATLTAPAEEAVSVSLSSSNPLLLPLPPAIVIPKGAFSASATVTPTTVAAPQCFIAPACVTPTASLNGVMRKTLLLLSPAIPTQVILSPHIAGSNRTTTYNSVLLTGPVPPGGSVVTITSSDPAVAAAPGAIQVAAGATQVPFSLNLPFRASATSVTITATMNGRSAAETLVVGPVAAEDLETRAYYNYGTQTTTDPLVWLNAPAPPGGALLSVAVSRPDLVTVPSSLLIPAGNRSYPLPLTAARTGPPSLSNVSLSASYNGVTAAADISVGPPQIDTLAVTSSSGTVTLLAPAPEGGVQVKLASSQPGVLSVPAAVAIPAGAWSADFSVTASSSSAGSSVMVLAELNGSWRGAPVAVGSQ